MKKKKFTRSKISNVRREREPVPWKYCLLTVFCGLLLASGFFWAARQHFFSMDYGMRNATLRNEIEELQSKNRRLKLEREVALSPSEIKKAATKIGLAGITVRNIEIVRRESTGDVPTSPEPQTGEMQTIAAYNPKSKLDPASTAARIRLTVSSERTDARKTGKSPKADKKKSGTISDSAITRR